VAEQKQQVAQEAAAVEAAAARKAAAVEAAAERKVQEAAAARANLPINILGTAYASYVDVKRCQEARDGYATIYISNPEMDQARDAVLTIEQTMKSSQT
jgi:hypothetical protein